MKLKEIHSKLKAEVAVKKASPFAEISYLGAELFEAHGFLFWAVAVLFVLAVAKFLLGLAVAE